MSNNGRTSGFMSGWHPNPNVNGPCHCGRGRYKMLEYWMAFCSSSHRLSYLEHSSIRQLYRPWTSWTSSFSASLASLLLSPAPLLTLRNEATPMLVWLTTKLACKFAMVAHPDSYMYSALNIIGERAERPTMTTNMYAAIILIHNSQIQCSSDSYRLLPWTLM